MKKSIGTISLGEISFLSDSCYGTYSNLNTTIKTKPGEYKVYVTYCEDKDDFLKGRIGSLIAIHKDAKDKTFPTDDRENLKCYVDSGTCGIFDGEYFEETHTADDVDDDWYEKFVIPMDNYVITDGKGAISSSGIGDGCYKVYARYENGVATAIRIKYL